MSDGVHITLRGEDQMKQALLRAAFLYPKAAAVALYRMGERLMRDAIRRVPVNTGELRASAYVTQATGGDRPRIEVGFGSEHAVPLHEKTHVHHVTGEAKFLQRALDDQVKSFVETFGGEMKAAVQSNAGVSGGEFPPTPHSNEERARSGSHHEQRRTQLRDRIRRSGR